MAWGRVVAAATAALLCSALTVGCGGGGGGGDSVVPPPPPPPPAQQYRPTGKGAAGETFAVLWEWPWADVALACERQLGPDGYGAVMVSAPNEHATLRGFPWYQRYQPVSYKLDQSRSGSLAQFTDMINRCNARNVAVYVDAIINHMAADTGINGLGSAGSAYQRYVYPAVPYGSSDFHPPCAVNNYQSATNVQNCELVSLPDLRTEAEEVRQKVANYLIALNQFGVKGFRIDAAKHIAPADIDAILAKVNNAATNAGRALPYVFLEIINNPNEAVTPQQYYGVGFASGGAADTNEFIATYQLTDALLGRNGRSLNDLANFGQGLLPSDKAQVFVANHDTERGSNLYIGDGAAYTLAQIFLLAHPYGYPSVHSGYRFDRATQAGRDAGPSSDASGKTSPVFLGPTGPTPPGGNLTPCGVAPTADAWTCDHATFGPMVGFRKAAAGAALSDWQSPAPNVVGFARTQRGFVSLNRSLAASSNVWRTSLPGGRYCNVAANRFDSATKACSGAPIQVAADGTVSLTLAPNSAVALHVGARLD